MTKVTYNVISTNPNGGVYIKKNIKSYLQAALMAASVHGRVVTCYEETEIKEPAKPAKFRLSTKI